ncbi:YbaN family protein [Litoribacillus peritrichatus]|uniref:Inner membrane protein n=1 Tax=Litoribacillus peritrichatus TaxID=718191 RepID=A0ABP7MYD8_9GAMM
MDRLVSNLDKRKHPVIHWTLLIVGWSAVILGVLGIFLPILPTTPFLLLAAACFARTSDKFYYWLIHHPKLGTFIAAYLDGKGIPLKAKCYTSALMITMMTISAYLVQPPIWAIITMYLIAVCVSVYLFRLPTLEVKKTESQNRNNSEV